MDTDHVQAEPWLLRLKRAVEAGYYKTEAALGQQESFPWQDKSCGDCPFWLDTQWCQVHAEGRNATDHTCAYFDPPYRLAARHIIDEQRRRAQRSLWDWLSGNR